jgi:putative transposase
MHNLQDKTIKELAKDCRTVEDVHEMLKNLFKDTIQQVFEAELDDHLGYQKHSTEGTNSGNSRIMGIARKPLKLSLAMQR